MPFGNKLKTTSKLASVNRLVRLDPDIRNVLNADPVLITQQTLMFSIIDAVRHKFVGGNTGGYEPTPKPFPCSKARWFGELSLDSTTKTLKEGKTVYTYDHKSAFAENANLFRGRTDDIIKYFEMSNDLLQSSKKPNPGGVAGTHGDLPVVVPGSLGVGGAGGGS